MIVLAATMCAAQAEARRETLGVHRSWAAFKADRPARCYAIAAPENATPRAFASVGVWPGRRGPGQLHLRFHRPARPGSAVVLTVDGGLFQLVSRGLDAWAPSAAADRAIVAAMRTGLAMTVTARDAAGGAMTFRYALAGAATAIDAAALACRPGRDG